MPRQFGLAMCRTGEWLSYSAGLLLTGFFVSQLANGEIDRQQGLNEFEQQRQVQSQQHLLAQSQQSLQDQPQPQQHSQKDASSTDSSSTGANSQSFSAADTGAPDTSLWAPGRIADYEQSVKGELPPVMAVLEIPSVKLKVPVYSTATDLNMDRGAGVINGMAYPHEGGNIGISGHRDGYFRVLKDIKVGDRIMLETLEGPKRFVIESHEVVEISDTSVLKDTEDQQLTLVTCYPFYFVGHAPQRFIVKASLDTTYVNQQ